jgi:hypothetical protein
LYIYLCSTLISLQVLLYCSTLLTYTRVQVVMAAVREHGDALNFATVEMRADSALCCVGQSCHSFVRANVYM